MLEKFHYISYTEKKQPKKEITLDSNAVAYLYLLHKGHLTPQEYTRLKNALTGEQFQILSKIANNLEKFTFNTTPQVIHEIVACAKLKGDYGIVNFLEGICKVHIPRTRAEKEKYAETIVDLMEEYLRRDIPLSNDVREYQSAIASEVKHGEENFADAKSVAENNTLNGKSPYATRNEKHLVSMEGFRRKNNFRSQAIRDKNIKFLKSNTKVRPHKRVIANLKSELSTTCRINELPELLDL